MVLAMTQFCMNFTYLLPDICLSTLFQGVIWGAAMGKGKILLWRRWKKDLKQLALAPVLLCFFALLISQSPPVCITVPLPDSKIAVLGSYHFELPSVSFSSQISKPLEAAPWTFFLTSQQLLMSSENSLKTWKQALLPLTATCNHSNTLPWACS